MLRQAAKKAVQVPAGSRGFYALSIDFTEDVAPPKPKGGAPPILSEWAAKRAETEAALKMAATYRDLGDVAGEPYLAPHNPRAYEDLDAPIPNFKKFNLKAGEVPKFFDGVLQARAGAAVAAKDAWWAARRETAEEAVKERTFKPFAPLPAPAWSLGASVPLSTLAAATDKLVAAMEPKRKLAAPNAAAVSAALSSFTKSLGPDGGAALAESVAKSVASAVTVTENGKPVPGFKFMSAAEAEAKLQARRAEIHSRFVKMWAKRVLAAPEQALVPLKERDSLLASKFEDVSDKYNSLVDAVASGPQPYGERLAGCAATDGFFLRRSKAEIGAEFPPSEQDKEAAALATQLADPSVALSKLLGPALMPPGSGGRPKSEETAELTDHLYTPERYMHAEGLKLAARYKAEEDAAEAAAKALYGDDAPVARGPKAPLAALADAAKAAAARVKVLQAEKEAAAGDAYAQYALDAQIKFASDPSNAAFDDVLHPEIVKERFEIEMAELDAAEAALQEAEEEEAWALTLARQARHIHQNLEFDLPQSAYAHMDPILYKKIDWEVTHGHDTLHHEAFQAADCEQGEYVKDQMGLEALSHHLLPLIRYRRAKARAAGRPFVPELTALPAAATPAGGASLAP